MTTPPDFRALCAELNSWLIEIAATHPRLSGLAIDRLNDATGRAIDAERQANSAASGPDDCDDEGRCWLGSWDGDSGHWFWMFADPEQVGGWALRLPFSAIPLPEAFE